MRAIRPTTPPDGLGRVEAWIFDLDNTLYPASCNLFGQIDALIRAFIRDLLGVGEAEARGIQKGYYHAHGTTLRGLMVHHGVEPEAFLDFVHLIDHSVVPPDPALDAVLGRLPGRKLIFTNGTASHAEKVVERLGVSRHFEAVFDIAAADYRPKPEMGSYRTLVRAHGLDPAATVMVEDIARNLAPAAALGMTTVWLRNDSPFGREGATGPHVHHIADELVPWLEEAAPAQR